MKRMVLTLAALFLWLSLGAGAWAEEPEPDWLGLLREAVLADDREAGLAAAEGWNADESRPPLDYDELRLLAKLITWEAGSHWLTDELRLGVGEVALNRVASPEFPDCCMHRRRPASAAGRADPPAPGGLFRSRGAGQGPFRFPGHALRQLLFLREQLPGAL